MPIKKEDLDKEKLRLKKLGLNHNIVRISNGPLFNDVYFIDNVNRTDDKLKETLDKSRERIKKIILEEIGDDAVDEGDKFNYNMNDQYNIKTYKSYSKKKSHSKN